MKRISALLLVSLSALIPSVNATSVTIDTATADTFIFDVVWGQWAFPPWDVTVSGSSPHPYTVSAHDNGWLTLSLHVSYPTLGINDDLEFGIGDGWFPPYGHQEHAPWREGAFSVPGGVVLPSPQDVYGARFVFTRVPETGSSLALLGLAVAACVWLGTQKLRGSAASCKPGCFPASQEGWRWHD